MADLRQKLIKLAHEVPETRKYILPMLREAAYTVYWPDGDPKAPETPWGPADTGHKLMPGVWMYSTSSHGGMSFEGPVARKLLSAAARSEALSFKGHLWFEEDSAALIPFYEVPQLADAAVKAGFSAKLKNPEYVREALKRNESSYLARYDKEVGTPHLAGIQQKRAVRDWDKEFRNDNVRVRWNDIEIEVQELPGKPVKRKVRRTSFGFDEYGYSSFLATNAMRKVALNAGATFDSVVKDITEARQKLILEAPSAPAWLRTEVERGKPWIDTISFLEVEPADYKPMTIKGKDFVVTSGWKKFEAYSPNSDFDQPDPHYSVYEQKSPGAARRLFLILKADSTLLRGVTYSNFGTWLQKAGIGYEMHFSVWR